jgi:hypothetical protein
MKAMRVWALLGASLTAFGLVACGDDDDGNPTGGTGGADAGKVDAKVDAKVDTSSTMDARVDTTADNRDTSVTPDATDGGGAAEGGGNTEGGDGGSPVQRGEYLVKNLGACGDCHTPINFLTGQPDNTKFLAGFAGIFQIPGLGPDGGNGVIGSSNLTPDMTTGLGSWTDAQIKRALLDGVDKDNKPLFPIMPYYVLHNMSPADADAIVAYLRTIPAVNNVIPARNFDLPGAAPPVPADKIPDPVIAMTDPNYASAMRGKYLAGNFGLCMECHTEHVQTPGAVPLNLDKLFAGGETFISAAIGLPSPPYPATITSENITPHATGVQGWTAAAIANVMKNGVDKDGVAICPPMPNGPNGAFGGLTDADRLDIGNYIVHLPPIDNTIAAVCHDIMNRDGGGPDGGPDVTPQPEGGNDVVDATNPPPDNTPTPDATNDGAGDTGGGSDGTSGDGASDGTSGDAASDGTSGDGTSDGSNGDGSNGDAADSAG